MKCWRNCTNILVIRPDNLGDLLMSSPAIRALKETFGAKITVLTSTMASGIARMIPEIDDVITYDLPWVKTSNEIPADAFFDLVKHIEGRTFDAAVIFTVYSQNPLPSAMLAYLARIPLRLAYCRENPYDLLTDWMPDKEPYTFIKHQVKRDLDLVASVGAIVTDDSLSVAGDEVYSPSVYGKLRDAGVELQQPWLILHPGVSEQKREYPAELWIRTGRRLINELKVQLLITGTPNEKSLTDLLAARIGTAAYSMAGTFSLPEFIHLNRIAPLVISVNTGTVHIAAATATPVVVLYALTNPQHAPWKVKSKVLPFDVPVNARSKNEIIRYVHEHLSLQNVKMAEPQEIVEAVRELLDPNSHSTPPQLVALKATAID